jgi:hypothetical protein
MCDRSIIEGKRDTAWRRPGYIRSGIRDQISQRDPYVFIGGTIDDGFEKRCGMPIFGLMR